MGKEIVVVVADDPSDCTYVADLVGKAGYGVVGEATSYEEASALVKKHQPALLIINIPFGDDHIDGDILIDELDEASIPVLVLITNMSPLERFHCVDGRRWVTARNKGYTSSIVETIQEILGDALKDED